MGSSLKLDPTKLKPFSVQQQLASAFLRQNKIPHLGNGTSYNVPSMFDLESETVSIQFEYGLILFQTTEEGVEYAVVDGVAIWDELLKTSVIAQIGLLRVLNSGYVSYQEKPGKVIIHYANKKNPISQYREYCEETAIVLNQTKLNVHKQSKNAYLCHRFIEPRAALSLQEYLTKLSDAPMVEKLKLALKIVYSYSDQFTIANKTHGNFKSKYIFIDKNDDQVFILRSGSIKKDEQEDFKELLNVVHMITNIEYSSESMVSLIQDLLLAISNQYIKDYPAYAADYLDANNAVSSLISPLYLAKADPLYFKDELNRIRTIINEKISEIRYLSSCPSVISFFVFIFNMQSLNNVTSKDAMIERIQCSFDHLNDDLSKLNHLRIRAFKLKEIFQKITHPKYSLIAERVLSFEAEMNSFFTTMGNVCLFLNRMDILTEEVTNFLMGIQVEEFNLIDSFDDTSLLFNSIIDSYLFYQDKNEEFRLSILDQLMSYVCQTFTDSSIAKGDLSASDRRRRDLQAMLDCINSSNLSNDELRFEINKTIANMKGGFFLFSNSTLKSKVSSVLNRVEVKADKEASAFHEFSCTPQAS